jgi:hypothetical protein
MFNFVLDILHWWVINLAAFGLKLIAKLPIW